MPLWGPSKAQDSLSCLKHENLDMPEMQKSLEGVVAEPLNLRQAASGLRCVPLHLNETDSQCLAQPWAPTLNKNGSLVGGDYDIILFLPSMQDTWQQCRKAGTFRSLEHSVLAVSEGQFAFECTDLVEAHSNKSTCRSNL